MFERIFLDVGIALRFKKRMVAEAVDAPSRKKLIALIQAQAAQIATLVARVAELERRLGFSSSNSASRRRATG